MENAYANALSMCGVAVCALQQLHWQRLPADAVAWKVNRSQYVQVVSAKPAPISRNRWVFRTRNSGKCGGD